MPTAATDARLARAMRDQARRECFGDSDAADDGEPVIEPGAADVRREADVGDAIRCYCHPRWPM